MIARMEPESRGEEAVPPDPDEVRAVANLLVATLYRRPGGVTAAEFARLAARYDRETRAAGVRSVLARGWAVEVWRYDARRDEGEWVYRTWAGGARVRQSR